jgi:transcriptional regulator with XRE-family HTH domain
MTLDELALRIERLRIARRVRFDELAAAIDLTARALRRRMLGDIAFSETELWSIACALEAPAGWPEREPGELPTDPIALSAPSPRPASQHVPKSLPPRATDLLEAEPLLLGGEVLRQLEREWSDCLADGALHPLPGCGCRGRERLGPERRPRVALDLASLCPREVPDACDDREVRQDHGARERGERERRAPRLRQALEPELQHAAILPSERADAADDQAERDAGSAAPQGPAKELPLRDLLARLDPRLVVPAELDLVRPGLRIEVETALGRHEDELAAGEP